MLSESYHVGHWPRQPLKLHSALTLEMSLLAKNELNSDVIMISLKKS